MPTGLAICVDAGQTATKVVLLGANEIPRRAQDGAALIPPDRPGASERIRQVINGIVQSVAAIDADLNDRVDVVAMSLSGFSIVGADAHTDLVDIVRNRWPSVRLVVTAADYVAHWMAATRGRPGAVIIAGGGALAYGCWPGGDRLVGGFGHLLGDEGSAYWMGLEALRSAVRARSGLGDETDWSRALLAGLGTSDYRDVIRRHAREADDAWIGALAPSVVDSAIAGDPICVDVLDRGLDHLAALAAATVRNVGDVPWYLAGGLFRSAWMRDRMRARLELEQLDPGDGGSPAEVCIGLIRAAKSLDPASAEPTERPCIRPWPRNDLLRVTVPSTSR